MIKFIELFWFEISQTVNSDSFEAYFHLDRLVFDYKEVRGSNPRPVKYYLNS